MTVEAPEPAARLAARILVIMPPGRCWSRRRRPSPPAPDRRRRLRARTWRRVLARVGRVQALLVGQDDQRIGLDQVGHQRAQRVVVAELDLVVDDRVVLVDDRHHAQLEQGEQRRARVEVALAVGQVGVREQHLGAADPFSRSLVSYIWARPIWPDGGGGLQLVDFVRPRGQPRRFMPSAMAPLDTMITSRPSRTSAASCRHHSPMAPRPGRGPRWSRGWSPP
jgi:hypothetical protein